MSLYRTNVRILQTALLFAAATPHAAMAAGFYIQEQNAAGVGRAQAGDVVADDDASTVYFNPSGLSFLDGPQATLGADVIFPKATLTDKGSYNTSTGAYLANASVANPAQRPVSLPGGNNGGNPGSPTPIPDFYASVPLSGSGFTFGLGVTAPFGFVSKYTAGAFARYDSVESLLETADFAPTVAWKINSSLSIGAGLDEQYAHAKLTTALPNPLQPGGPTVASDGQLKLTGVNWATGFNVGITFAPSDDTKIGATYRSAITHTINGQVTFAGLSGPLAARNGVVGGTAALNLPDIITAGISQKIAPDLTLLAEVDYTGWSKFQNITIQLGDGSGNLVTPENYRNTWSGSAGLEYQIDPQLKLRGGVKYDQTPTVDAFRDTRVPDGDRFWLSAGLRYAFTSAMSLDVGYSHIFLKSTPIDVTRAFYTTAALPVPTTAVIDAQSQVKLDILSLGLNFRF